MTPCAKSHRIALAAAFIASSPAMRLAHGATTLGAHLLATAAILAEENQLGVCRICLNAAH